MRLKTEFMGLSLENPLIVAAGPWSRNPKTILKAMEAGAAAVVTETIAMEVRHNVRPWIHAKNDGYQNVRLYSDHALEQWYEFIQEISKSKGKVIASIMGHSPSEMGYIAKTVSKAGASALELGLSIPHGEGVAVMGSDPDRLYQSIKSVINNVDIPVMVKFSPHVTNISELAKVVERAGASCISGIDTVRSIIGVDLDTFKPHLATYGGYSGAPIKPIGLATIASIAQSVKIPICGIGGIKSAEDALEYMMLGASTFQVGSAIMSDGYEVIETILRDLDLWLTARNLSAHDIVGKALDSLKSFDEIEILPYRAVVESPCEMENCENCQNGCLVDAISSFNGLVAIDPERCNGCGLCVSLCEKKKIALRWRNFELI